MSVNTEQKTERIFKMKPKNHLVLLLSLLLLLSSCSQNGGNSENDGKESAGNDQNPSSTETETEEETLIKDNLPETNLNGYDFRIYVSNEKMASFFYTEETNGEVVNDAIRSAILNTSNRFNTSISAIILDATDEGVYSDAVKNAITVNDNSFDVAEMHDTTAGKMSLENLFLNLRNINHLDFDMPWYPSNAVESLTVEGKLYLYSSAISYKGLHQTRILYMNKKLLNDRGIASPYDDVFAGTWTLDKLSAITNNAYSDLNSNGVADEDDFFGFTVHKWFDGWMESFGLETVVHDPDSVLAIGVGDERTYSAVDKMYSWITNGKDTYICNMKGGDTKSEKDIFSEERTLITYGEIYNSYDTYRLTDVDYGMLPFPKLDDSQENYISFYTDRFFVIPNTAQDTDTIGLMLEAMSAEGYRTVYPAYYEIALKGKYAQDIESRKILDIINDSRLMSFTYVYSDSPLNNIFRNLLANSNPSADYASFYKKNLKAAEKNVKKLVDTFEKLN